MVIQKASIGFKKYSDAKFEQKASDIFNSMDKNVNFPSPEPVATLVQDAVLRYTAALLAASSLDRNSVAEKNESRRSLQDMLVQWAIYVTFVAKGNVKLLTSSGFDITKMPEKRYISTPENLTLSNGLSAGELTASVKAVKGAGNYQYEITDAPPAENTVWSSTSTGTSKYTFKALKPGKQYWVRVAAIGSRQQIAYSQVVNQFVQ